MEAMWEIKMVKGMANLMDETMDKMMGTMRGALMEKVMGPCLEDKLAREWPQT